MVLTRGSGFCEMNNPIPNVNHPIWTGGQSLDPRWHRWLRNHAEDKYAHGWSLLSDKAIGVGQTSIAHGLGSTPTEVIMVSDDARPVSLRYSLSADQALTSGTNTIELDTKLFDLGDDFDVVNHRCVAPHTGIYRATLNTALSAFPTGHAISGLAHWSADFDYVFILDNNSGVSVYANSSNSASRVIDEGQAIEFSYSTTATTGNLRGALAGMCFGQLESDDKWSFGTHNATEINVWSARERTMSFLVR